MPFDIDAARLPEAEEEESLQPETGITAVASDGLGLNPEIFSGGAEPGNSGESADAPPFDSAEIKEIKPTSGDAEVAATADVDAPTWRPGRRSEPERPYQRTPEEQVSFEAACREGRRRNALTACDLVGGGR